MLPPPDGLLRSGTGSRMAVDKRFWTGAVAIVTVVTAGASALPSLLLAPADPVPLVAPVAGKAPEKPPEPFRTVASEPPAPVRAEPQRQAEAAPAAVAVSAPVVTVSAPPPPPAEPVAAAAPPPAAPTPAPAAAFPPVQPVGIASETAAVAPQSRPAGTEQRAARHIRQREARAAQSGRKRALRPARYPIREFLAWRR